MADYVPPQGNIIALNFRGDGYTPPLGNKIGLEFSLGLDEPIIGPTQYLFPSGELQQSVSVPAIRLQYIYVSPESLTTPIFNTPKVRNNNTAVSPKTWQSSNIGAQASIINFHQSIAAKAWQSDIISKPLVYNLLQFVRARQFDASLYGTPYLIGGVKYLAPRPYDASAFGRLDLTNTTSDQEAKPKGIDSLDIACPNVSPRMLYARGVDSLAIGSPNARDPALKPLGELHTAYGAPTIWFHTRSLAPADILSFELGYVRIADPTQFAYPLSLLTSAIFGDTATRNLSFKVSVPAIYDDGFSDYSTLTNSNRYYEVKGIYSASIGALAIKNKTPSIFAGGITHYDIGLPAIGHAIRYTQPTGVDHPSFGRATLTKTPELFPRGHRSSAVGPAWISYKNRDIELSQKGIDAFKAGTQVVWYGQRLVKTKGWQTADYGKPVLTHEVRELIVQGFKRDAYGTAWISQGTRAIEPQGIYKDSPFNHMVGGTQTIEPAGYETTLWGERIIPISQSVMPLGFADLWGNALIDLKTKYIAPVGYISVGQQPEDRWGDVGIYNKLQHIVQEYDFNSGLAPPKWSDYLLIANRNIQMNVTGFASQRFGYSQIDNNAMPLLPEAIIPPPIDGGMISHGVRTIAPEALEAPPVSTWSAIYNDGRVIAPPGFDSSLYGNYGKVVNTRREYRNIGRIDSFESGTPMIAYRVRTIDIEPRYSIAPPQINLPTIDLHTKYIGFNGYETAKYGTASLSIHFNIIGPSWRHSDKFGYNTVRNVTPELQVGAFDSSEYGKPNVRTQWREIKAQGDTATLFGGAMIADRKQGIDIRSWQDTNVSQKHRVGQTSTNPYVVQNIFLNDEASNGGGKGFDASSLGTPYLNQNVMYQKGHASSRFGLGSIRSNNLEVVPGIAIDSFSSSPLSIFNKNRYVSLDNLGIDNTIILGNKIRLSPNYIEQRNSYSANAGGKQVGNHTFTLQHRTLIGRGFKSDNIGKPFIELKDRYIEPTTINRSSLGIPSIPFTPQSINLVQGIHGSNYGVASVDRPPYIGPQTIKARGLGSLATGNHVIDLYIRRLTAIGSDSLVVGKSLSNDTPYMWQGLRVGEFVPMKISAGDTSVFGETRIGLRVREVSLEGFVAFKSEYEITAFDKRIKVTGTVTDNSSAQSIVAVGIDSLFIGTSGIKWGQQFIRPDGNSEQFRKGAF